MVVAFYCLVPVFGNQEMKCLLRVLFNESALKTNLVLFARTKGGVCSAGRFWDGQACQAWQIGLTAWVNSGTKITCKERLSRPLGLRSGFGR